MVSNIVNLRPITIPSVKATINALSPTFGTQKQWDRYMMKFKKQALELYKKICYIPKETILFEHATFNMIMNVYFALFAKSYQMKLGNFDFLSEEEKLNISGLLLEDKEQREKAIEAAFDIGLSKFLDRSQCDLYMIRYVMSEDQICYLMDAIPSLMSENLSVYNTIVSSVLEGVCRSFVAYKGLSREIIEDNFVIMGFPENEQELWYIIKTFKSRVLSYVTLYLCTSAVYGDACYDKAKNVILEEEKEKLVKDNNDLRLELDRTKNQLEQQQYRATGYENKQATDNKSDAYQKRIKELETSLSNTAQQLRKHQKLYDALHKKYTQLLSQTMQEPETNADDSIEDELQIDYNKRYLFVSHSKPSFEKNIIKRFPNAMFLHSKKEPLPNEVDAVIAITIHTDHALYYYAKQYKSKGIPFIHCATKNIDIIEDEIIRVIGEVPEHD